jgi:hypothetical protein
MRCAHPGGELPGATVSLGVELEVSDRGRGCKGFWSEGVFASPPPSSHPAARPMIVMSRTTARRRSGLMTVPRAYPWQYFSPSVGILNRPRCRVAALSKFLSVVSAEVRN